MTFYLNLDLQSQIIVEVNQRTSVEDLKHLIHEAIGRNLTQGTINVDGRPLQKASDVNIKSHILVLPPTLINIIVPMAYGVEAKYQVPSSMLISDLKTTVERDSLCVTSLQSFRLGNTVLDVSKPLSEYISGTECRLIPVENSAAITSNIHQNATINNVITVNFLFELYLETPMMTNFLHLSAKLIDVAKFVSKKTGLTPYKQKYVKDGKILDINKNLYELGIVNNDNIFVTVTQDNTPLNPQEYAQGNMGRNQQFPAQAPSTQQGVSTSAQSEEEVLITVFVSDKDDDPNALTLKLSPTASTQDLYDRVGRLLRRDSNRFDLLFNGRLIEPFRLLKDYDIDHYSDLVWHPK